MNSETINKIEVLETGELLVGIESQGKPMFQYVYREAAGVYWDQSRKGFKSTPMREWSCSQWFKQIIEVVRSGFGVELKLGANVIWLNVPEKQKTEIQSENAI
jgi:hypothetical protein